jgi:hypothetical protein
MLKTVSSVANALGALNYKGTWNATTNTPTLASGVGTQGDYYVVSVAGATDLDGITNWGVGDWAAFNGSVWQRVEGGADGNFVDLTVTGQATVGNINSISNTISSTNIDGDILITPNGSGKVGIGRTPSHKIDIAGSYGANGSELITSDGFSNYLKTGATLYIQGGNNIVYQGGNLVVNSGNGIDFSATAGTGTSELFDDYEEGDWTPSADFGTINGTSITYVGKYTKVGDTVTILIKASSASADIEVPSYVGFTGLPFAAVHDGTSTVVTEDIDVFARQGFASTSSTALFFSASGSATGTGKLICSLTYKV